MYFMKGNAIINIITNRFRTTVYLCSSLSFTAKLDSRKMGSRTNVIKRYDNIIKSAEDKRLYRGLELSNRMKVMLVSDPTTDKSSAALDVNVGYMCDPDYLPGLAHFCEHMLFLGTEKFPNENDYSKFLSEHGGNANAATYPDHTTYYFDVVPDHLKSAMERFSQFFLTPLFTEAATERELNAVNSEHEKNIPSDGWRMDQLDRHTANPDHPYHKFGTGNKQTLEILPKKNGINVRDELLQFHKSWYSSNIMCLAVLGKETLEELEQMVVELFSEVEDKNVIAPEWTEHPFKDEQLGTITYMVPVKDIRSLNVLFPCPDLKQYYKSSPSGYLSHLVGHEGPGSLLSALKDKGWSNSLMAGYKSPNRGTGFFGISLDLTEEGIEHTDEIVMMIFQYFNMLKRTPPLQWIHEENSTISAMAFRFKDKESPRSYIEGMVRNLQDYPLEHALCHSLLITEWTPDIIEMLLNSFVPERIRIGIIAKKFENIATSNEPWYGTSYITQKIPKEILETWKKTGLTDSLSLPDKNDFIPENFNLLPLDKDITETPVIIKDTAISRVWFKQDDTFLLPKANLMFDFVSPITYIDPLNINLTRMFIQLFRDALNQYTYSAELAGLKWDLNGSKYGLILNVVGFSDKQHVFLEKILEKLTNFKIDPKRFEIFKENYIRMLNNFAAEQPYQHAVYHLGLLLSEYSWTKQELLDATEQLTVEKLEAFIPQMLSKMHIECLIHGNINKQKALDIVEIVENKINSTVNVSPLLPRQLLLTRELKLEDGCNYLYEVQNDVHKSSCVEVYYQCGVQNTERNVLLELFSQIIQEPCFNILRTKEQLGYIVFSGLRRTSGVQGLRVIVQSDRHPVYVDERIEEFLKTMEKYLEEMSEEEFNKHKEALAAQRLEKPKQLSMQTFIYWSEITAQQYHFNRAPIEVAHLKKLTKTDVIKFYKQLLAEYAEERRKIGIHVVSMAEGGAGTMPQTDKEQRGQQFIQDVTVFKSAHEMYSLVQPYMNITRKGNKSKL